MELIRREATPVVAILVTHPIPTRSAASVCQDAFSGTPIKSDGDQHWIETDPEGFFEMTRSALGDDFAPWCGGRTASFALRLGGLTIRSAQFRPGKHVTQTLYDLPSSRTTVCW
jgi:hypothetical protein